MGCYIFSSVVHLTIGSQGRYFCQIWDGGEGCILMDSEASVCNNALKPDTPENERNKKRQFVADNLKCIRQGWQEDRQTVAIRYDETA